MENSSSVHLALKAEGTAYLVSLFAQMSNQLINNIVYIFMYSDKNYPREIKVDQNQTALIIRQDNCDYSNSLQMTERRDCIMMCHKYSVLLSLDLALTTTTTLKLLLNVKIKQKIHFILLNSWKQPNWFPFCTHNLLDLRRKRWPAYVKHVIVI